MSKARNVLWNVVKWGVMIGSYVAIISSYWMVDSWGKEILASLAAIGFAATIAFWWKDR